MIIIHAVFHIHAERQQAFLEEIQPLIAASRAEGGNVSYDLLQDTEQDHVFRMVEIWQDEQAVASHNSSDHFTGFVAKASRFLTAPLEVKAYQAEALKA
ncbi:antibiotic biosynthesis monooxygenase [Paenibacillus selenitireducens]|uniref:Antibiotic biosynthesis monooxygenase n=1 Tax=Paenibacillus selenitireducens TaxID=1324314 RepID=A0A1T2XLZ4_9BACL|nr:putative quinol monooxygenase [Paenibacillus selenitireducens]OPA80838.1 antibiotic biosynthesis monooxygenase [Paenibacillus selenitireducens]